MQILEQFTASKTGNDSLNEDAIVITDDFVAVLDGATSRQGKTLEGVSNGRFAAQTLAAEIKQLPQDITARAAIDHLTAVLKAATEKAAAAEGQALFEIWSWPAAAVLIYSRTRKEIWRVADSTFVIDGKTHERFFPQEKLWAGIRQACLQAQIIKGLSVEQLIDNDPTWPMLTPLIAELKIYANNNHPMASPYGYGVVNGAAVPDGFLEINKAATAQEIIFASDGYLDVRATLAETEEALFDTIRKDPLMFQIHPQVKGVKRGAVSFDDRSYLRFRP